ncbi:MAG: hypothetical protein ACPGSD_04395 [Flavobacteriales bacterium]
MCIKRIIKNNFYLVFTLFIVSCLSKTNISGRYIGIKEYYSEEINFRKDNQFKFKSFGCLGGYEDEGVYTLSSDSLILMFDDPFINKSVVNITDSSEALLDSISIEIKLFDGKDPDILGDIDLINVNDFDEKYSLNQINFDLSFHIKLLKSEQIYKLIINGESGLFLDLKAKCETEFKANKNFVFTSHLVYSKPINHFFYRKKRAYQIKNRKRNRIELENIILEKRTWFKDLKQRLKNRNARYK